MQDSLTYDYGKISCQGWLGVGLDIRGFAGWLSYIEVLDY